MSTVRRREIHKERKKERARGKQRQKKERETLREKGKVCGPWDVIL